MADDFKDEFLEANKLLVDKIGEWKTEMVDVIGKYHADLAVIKTAKDLIDTQQIKFWYIYRKYIITGIIILCCFVGFSYLITRTKFCGQIKIPVPYSSDPLEFNNQTSCQKTP